MRLHMVELAVADLPASLAFYRDRLGLPVELVDAAGGFALLHAGGRLALKGARPAAARRFIWKSPPLTPSCSG